MKRLVVMHSALAVPEFVAKLRQSVDLDEITPYSQGTRALYGTMNEKTFALYKRPARRSDFAGGLFGTIMSQAGGTRVEAHFDTPPWIRYLTRLLIGVVVLVGYPRFIQVTMNFHSGNSSSLQNWVGLIVLPTMIVAATLIPTILRRFGRRDRQRILEYLQQATALQVEDIDRAID